MKVKGIGEVEIEIYGGVKRTLGDVRYVPKFDKNLFSLGRLEAMEALLKQLEGLWNSLGGALCS